MAKFGIGITTWRAVAYFKQCLDTLQRNDLADVDVHIYQDGELCQISGNRRTDPAAIAGNRAVFDGADIPHKFWHQHERNVGYYNNRFGMLDMLGSNYDGFLTLEDDVIVSAHCVHIIRRLINQFRGDPRVGLISPGMRRRCKPEDADNNWDAVLLNDGRTSRLCVTAMSAATWQAVKPNYQEYGGLIASVPYHQIGEAHIREAVKRWAIGKGSDITEVSGDTALLRASLLVGRQRMFCVLNRSTNIGDSGLNCTPEILAQLGDGHQPIYENESELAIQEFRIVEGQA